MSVIDGEFTIVIYNISMWFDVSVLLFGWLIGNMIFYKFEMHVPIWRRMLKVCIVVSLLVVIYQYAGRGWFYGVLGTMFTGVAVIHGYYLPKKGINGITAEPYDKYLSEIRKIKQK